MGGVLGDRVKQFMALRNINWALDGVAQWTEHRPANQTVTGSVPSQGICLGSGPGPQYGARKEQPQERFLSLSFSFPYPLRHRYLDINK